MAFTEPSSPYRRVRRVRSRRGSSRAKHAVACRCSAELLCKRDSVEQLRRLGPRESRHKFSPFAIQIEQVESEHANLPPEFSIASYEKLVEEVQRTKKFRYVYRSGDRRAGSVPHLVVLRVEVESFKKGNERERELTMVAGATVITASAQICTRDGVPLVQGERTGKGENLEAAGKLAKNVAKLVRQTL